MSMMYVPAMALQEGGIYQGADGKRLAYTGLQNDGYAIMVYIFEGDLDAMVFADVGGIKVRDPGEDFDATQLMRVGVTPNNSVTSALRVIGRQYIRARSGYLVVDEAISDFQRFNNAVLDWVGDHELNGFDDMMESVAPQLKYLTLEGRLKEFSVSIDVTLTVPATVRVKARSESAAKDKVDGMGSNEIEDDVLNLPNSFANDVVSLDWDITNVEAE